MVLRGKGGGRRLRRRNEGGEKGLARVIRSEREFTAGLVQMMILKTEPPFFNAQQFLATLESSLWPRSLSTTLGQGRKV